MFVNSVETENNEVSMSENNHHFFSVLGRISFALDEKGKPVESSFVKRPTVLFSKNTATSTNAVKKHSGGPNRNNHVLMEFHLNKVSSI